MNYGAQEMGYGTAPEWAGNHAGYGSMMQHTGQGNLGQYDPAVAAAAAAAGGPGSLQGGAAVLPDGTLSYAALREAAAVNAAADCAAQDALRSIAAVQSTMHAVLNPDPATMGLDGGGSSGRYGADEATPSRRRSSAAGASAREHAGAAALLAVGGGGGGGRPNKGLRHFSMKVCEKVESKGTTSYNEVADELVAELKDGTMEDGICYDEKNIRRRVYDAINVLMALDIIAKEKKAIIWRGFPTSVSAAQQAQRLQSERMVVLGELNRKASYLSELVEQQKALKHLLERNSRNPDAAAGGTALHLPFILVQSKPDATVEVKISTDMQDVQFNFDNYPFEILDDALVLKKMLEHEEDQQRAAGAAAAAAAADPLAAAAALVEAAAAAQAMQASADSRQQEQPAGQQQQQQQQQQQGQQEEARPAKQGEQQQARAEQQVDAAAAEDAQQPAVGAAGSTQQGADAAVVVKAEEQQDDPMVS
uniref:E2F/DP family winged-helix DNA-binding domain-containing protein n=1 Tax=Tetradesmus obliquus TaxID=3088 RepID=A0A383VLQ3_TETOB|eukprot:jgi/Sobl393_1/15433/SZX65853.1